MERMTDERIAEVLKTYPRHMLALEELQRWREVEKLLRESAHRRNAFAEKCLAIIDQPAGGAK